jgi:hypothetical protein
MLLPLAGSVARRKSLEHHLALTILQDGGGDADVVSRLFNAVYLAYFIHEATSGRNGLDPFVAAETALHSAAIRGAAEGMWSLCDEGNAAVEQVLVLHDRQLANCPSYKVAHAQDRLNRFLKTQSISAISRD